MSTTESIPSGEELVTVAPAVEPGPTTDEAFAKMVQRLNKLSVEKHFDAYADIDWDAPDMALRPDDPRLRLPAIDPLAATDWYRSLSPDQQSTVALYRFASCMKVGWHFENLLQRGLLTYSFRQPNNSTSFRYLNHEIIEESQHTLMFQEFVNRSGLPVRGMPRGLAMLAELVVFRIVKLNPALFFVFVLGGEDPADHLQRSMLRDGIEHPLVERIMRIHVTEEARHLSFARHSLKRDVPRMGRLRRFELAVATPVILGIMARLMLVPSVDLRRHCGLPKTVNRAAFATPHGRQFLRDSVAKTRELCVELGVVTRLGKLLWRAVGLWDRPTAAPAGPTTTR